MFFNIFKRQKNRSTQKPQLFDLEGNELKEGDIVESLRYNLGACKIILKNEMYYYESLESGERVSWTRMIDAATEKQKVKLQKND